MSHETNPSNEPMDIDPALIGQINAVGDNLWDPEMFASLEHQLFQQYYDGLSELSPEEVPHFKVEYEVSGDTFIMTPVGDTKYGPLFEVTATGEEQGTRKGLFVFAGSLILPGEIDNLSAEQIAHIENIARGVSPEDRTLLRFLDEKYGMFTKGICDESYFVMFPASTPAKLETPRVEADAAYSAFEQYQYCGVQLKGSDSVVGIMIADKPVFSDDRIGSVTSLDFANNLPSTELLE